MFDFSMCLGGRRVGERSNKLLTYAFWLARGEKINAHHTPLGLCMGYTESTMSAAALADAIETLHLIPYVRLISE